MANISPKKEDFNFWDFVSCAKCRMPFSIDNCTATVPFWLTECGHVVCNNHLNPDQSCAQCGSQGIQLTPLQREMEAPMSEWFQSIPSGLDSIAYATKFQQEVMASQVRYHKARHQQLRLLLERLKREVTDLKKENDGLRHENNQYQLQMGYCANQQATSDVPNSNNKRQTLPVHQYRYADQRPRTGSSPSSATMPSGPPRLTLQPGHPLPELLSYRQSEQELRKLDPLMTHTYDISHESLPSRQNDASPYLAQRPPSVRSLERYAYIPPESKTHHLSQLTYVPHISNTFHNVAGIVQQSHQTFPSNGIPVSATSSRFKPARNMGPPPTPQHARNDVSGLSNKHTNLVSHRRESIVPTTPISGQPTLGAVPRRFFNSATLPRPSNATLPTGGHRTPFVSQSLDRRQNSGFRPA